MRSLAVLGASAALLSADPIPLTDPGPCAPGPVSQISGRGDVDAPPSERPLTIASLNVAGKSGMSDVLAAWVAHRTVDLLFLQEVGGELGDGAAFASAIGERLSFGSAYAPARHFDAGHAQGLAIVSRYPLDEVSVRVLPYNRLRFRSTCRIAVAATVRTPAGPVRVVNVHLDTRINTGRRIAQLESALGALNGFVGGRIVGGDFNTADVAWLNSTWPFPFFQRQAKVVRDRMTAEGFATPFIDTRGTFRLMGLRLKLDWLYLSQDLDTADVGVDDVPRTDHRGVWTRASATARRSGPTAARR